jgi:hypothetical protein
MVITHRKGKRFVCQDNGKDTFALLRTCRQIYAEASRIPYHANAFQLNFHKTKSCLSKIRAAHQKDIVELELVSYGAYNLLVGHDLVFKSLFPGLRRITVVDFLNFKKAERDPQKGRDLIQRIKDKNPGVDVLIDPRETEDINQYIRRYERIYHHSLTNFY